KAENGNDTLAGGKGDDLLEGGKGADAYLFSRGDGKDTIKDASGSSDVIRFADDIELEDITLKRSGDDLLIYILPSDNRDQSLSEVEDVIRIKDWDNASYRIESLQFAAGVSVPLSRFSSSFRKAAEGSTVSASSGHDWIEGAAGNETLKGKDGNDYLIGREGNDTLDGGDDYDSLFGGEGNDTLKGGKQNDLLVGGVGDDNLQGGTGDDTYVYSRGDGKDTISDENGSDDLLILTNLKLDEVTLRTDGNDLVIYVLDPDNPGAALADLSDSIRIKNWNSSSKRIDTLRFQDGYELQIGEQVGVIENIAALNVTRTQYTGLPKHLQSDQFEDWVASHQSSAVQDVTSLRSSLAEYVLHHFTGKFYLEAGKTYKFREDVDDGMLLKIGDQIVLSDNSYKYHTTATFTAEATGYYDFSFYAYNDGGPGDHRLQVADANQSTYNDIQVYQFDVLPEVGVITGANGNDIVDDLSGSHIIKGENGNDLLIARDGNDVIEGGASDDTYVFMRGFGHDTVLDTSGSMDKIQFADGITLADLRITNDNGDLQIYLMDAENRDQPLNEIADVLTIKNWTNTTSPIERFEFADGSSVSSIKIDSIGRVALQGTTGNDLIVGGERSNTINAGNGDDTLDAGGYSEHWQHLRGQKGNDTYLIGNENKNVWITQEAEWADSGNDTVRFKDLSLQDLTLSSYSHENYGEALRLQWDKDGQSGSLFLSDMGEHIERFQFADDSSVSSIRIDSIGRVALQGTTGNDLIVGGERSNTINAGDGDDTLDAGGYSEHWQHLRGQKGNDTYLIGNENKNVWITQEA
ncbi:calcium-binding protein, partial [Pseudovibrio sp. Ad5]|uniref:calcium-binding protein n=1 Tax=Pseudovibrio sp. Ad5 TaxID=989436 RepID=UPI000AAD3963